MGDAAVTAASAALRSAARSAAQSHARKRGLSWAIPAAAVTLSLLQWLRRRRGRGGPSQAPEKGGEGAAAAVVSSLPEDEPLEDVLLPASERVWEMYDEDAVEMLQSAADADALHMAALMRE